MARSNIWHIKTRKPGETEYKSVETQHQSREPRQGEVIEVAVGAKLIRAKIVHIHRSLSGSTGTFEIDAEQIEDRGKRPGHREADEDDF
jgi:hypothetical protein